MPAIIGPIDIETAGFEQVDGTAHMLAWLVSGFDVGRLVVTISSRSRIVRHAVFDYHVQREACRHNRSKAAGGFRGPLCDRHFSSDHKSQRADGVIWKQGVQHGYDTTNIDSLDVRRQLRLNFTVSGVANRETVL